MAGVHTFEVRVKDYKRTDEKLPYLRSAPIKTAERRGGEWIIQINPHRAEQTEDGRYKCVYGSLSAVEGVLLDARDKMEWSDDWRLSRVDLCFDLGSPYEETSRLTRLLLLVFSACYNLNNRYYSIDPLMNIERTFKVSEDVNGMRRPRLEAEHYDRSQKNQEKYDTQVINRLELRMTGKEIKKAGAQQSLQRASEYLVRQLQAAVSLGNMQSVTEACAMTLYDEWARAFQKIGTGRLPTFIRVNPQKVYTRKQIELLFDMNGDNAEQAAKNLCRTFRTELFKLVDLQSYVDLLTLAADSFLKN